MTSGASMSTKFSASSREGLGSNVIFDALASDDIDVYVDYSGTVWANEMKRTDKADRRAMLADIAEEKLEMLKEDAAKMRAKDLHELLRAWENYHRILTAEAHMKHIQFREESRYPGFYYRTDKNFVDEKNWHCFVNSIYDKTTHKWTCFKRKHVDLVDKSKLFKAAQ